MTTWVVSARGRLEVAAGDADIAAALALAPVISVSRLEAGRVRIESGGWVGTTASGDLRVVVEPKGLAPSTLAAMMAVAGGFALPPAAVRACAASEMYTGVASAFCDACVRLLASGLRRDYRTRRERSETLRGDLDFERWRGPRDPESVGRVPCAFRERTPDIAEHRALAWVLGRLGSDTSVPAPLRRRASALATRFGVERPPRPSLVDLAWCRRGGLFAPYAGPLDLAALLLTGLSASPFGRSSGVGFLIDVDRLFESWLLGRLRAWTPAGWSVRGNEHVLLATSPDAPLERWLDAVIRAPGGRVCAVIDAKNKLLSPRSPPPRDDVHQVVSYATAVGCDFAALVGLGGGEARDAYATRWEAASGALTLEAVALAGEGTYAALCAGLEAWLGRRRGEWARDRRSGRTSAPRRRPSAPDDRT